MRFPSVRSVLAALVLIRPVLAVDLGQLGDETARLDVTDASSVLMNVDNRNTRPADVSRVADDNWGLWYNRLNVQGNWGQWQAGLRLDSAWFYTKETPTDLALRLLEERHGGSLSPDLDRSDADFFLSMLDQSSIELANRYINWIYPAKYYLGFNSRDIEATVGDFYAQFGRGLVLSVRKFDELSSDTTVRGGRVTGRVRAGEFRLKMTGLAGTMNPLRVDEASGRYLSVGPEVTTGVARVTEGGMPRPVDDAFGRSGEITYAPDTLMGFQLEGGVRQVQVGVQGSWLERRSLDEEALSPGIVRSSDHITTGSVSINIPDLDEHGAAYLEVAGQNLDNPRTDIDPGYGIYASLNVSEQPVTVTVEARHYRRLFPLQANVDIGAAREFGPVQYSAPPTTEPVWLDTEFENFNTCVTGGRAKTDVAVGEHESVFAWVAHHQTWAESVANERCDTSRENLNRIWDLAVGTEISSQGHKSRAQASVGSRFDNTAEPISDPRGYETTIFYREAYLRYDVIQWVRGPYSLQLQGWHRRRRQTRGGPTDTYFQGQHLTALQWAPHWSVGIGVEYDTNPAFPDLYFNGQLSYRIDSASSVGIFAGQRRGGQRCVSGVCRIFPPFEGVRADATLRF